ncbi:hypothetical protein HN51_018105 [Arachis hypogaea]|uniref:Dof zinc finger protein n=2 Tax=Arachis TaxID=3817 RepID=A0A445BS98_ARAHY|nr:dof zinc finger protein DOF3.7 [Arachis duranensis]XP_025612674.1 dof zinc finger protein DOF3.7 [Arachis hypogaea]QHO29692.1 Dof zinc finger protein [Arachis hypogaea]RYR41569.1 hypothetical protein Ahy_A08g037976 [Arachis hypogaea]
MDTAQWAQGIGVVKAMEGSSTKACSSSSVLERRARPVKDQALNCPRCNSTNTKFCYYNNYSLSQPRYFCKTCRRYWTEGGSLRNVPVGGGSRKNKRSSSTPASSPSSSLTNKNPKIIHQGQDLNLAYPPPPPPPPHHHDDSATEFLRSGINTTTTSRGLNSFMPMSLSDSTMYSTAGFGAPMQEFIKSGGLNFSLEEGFESGGGGARVLFPSSEEKNTNRTDSTTAGFWNGMLGGASW